MVLQIDHIETHNLCKSVCKKFTGKHDSGNAWEITLGSFENHTSDVANNFL